MNKSYKFLLDKGKLLIILLLIFAVSSLCGCLKKTEDSYEIGTLTILGDGVEETIKLTVEEIKEIEDEQISVLYSSINNWPVKRFYVAKGIPLNYLLQKAGIKDTAQTIIIKGADNYSAILTRQQLEEVRYSFPKLLEDSSEGYEEVPALLAWEHKEGTNDITQANSGKLKLFLGQKSINDVTAAAFVKNVVAIEVLTTPPSRWADVEAEPAPGNVISGTEVYLNHPELDYTKIYYTIDGSTPNENSLVYNMSTSYYQPELINPIIINKPMTIKAIAIGIGKDDSKVKTFTYEVD